MTSDGQPKKINSRCEFGATLDMNEVIMSSDSF